MNSPAADPTPNESQTGTCGIRPKRKPSFSGGMCHRLAFVAVVCMAGNVAGDDTAPVTALQISDDGRLVAASSQDTIRVLDGTSLELIEEVRPSISQIHDLRLSKKQPRIYVAGGLPGEQGIVAARTWPELQPLWEQDVSEDVVYAIGENPDGTRLAAACHDSSIQRLHASDGTPDGSLTGHSKSVLTLLFVDDRTLVSGGRDQSIRVWDFSAGRVIRSLRNHTMPVSETVLRAAGPGLPMIASGGEDRTVRLWQPTIGRMVRFQRYRSPVVSVAFSRDGAHVIAGCRDGSVRVTDVVTLETVLLPDVSAGWVNCIAPHPDGETIITGCSTGRIRRLRLPDTTANR